MITLFQTFSALEYAVLCSAVVTLIAVCWPEDAPERPKGNGTYEDVPAAGSIRS
jgi:hypothetical protein